MTEAGVNVKPIACGQLSACAQAVLGESTRMNTAMTATRARPRKAAGITARAIAGVALFAAGGSAIAAGLAVESQGAQGGEFVFRVANTSQNRMDAVRFHAPDGYDIACSNQTVRGLSFAEGGSLQAGDRIECTARVEAQVRPRSGGFAVSGRERGGHVHTRNITVSTRGVTTPDQGFVVLIAGGVHNDSNADGILDAGELIDYHYTLLNPGTLPLSGLAVTDIGGAVTCPQTTLAVAQNIVCTRSYAITGANAAANEVFNQVDVQASDSLGDPVTGGDVVVHLNLQARAGIRVFKSPLLLNDDDGNGFVSPGDELFYTFVIKNSNAENLLNVDLTELNPALINGPIACQGTTLGGQPFAGLGSGQLASQDTLLCTAGYTVQASDGAAGQILNVVEATAQAPIAGPVQGTGASLVLLPGQSALLLTKSASPLMFLPGGTVTYTIQVTNVGSLPIANVQITDPIPTGVASFNWTCAGVYCPNPAGTGAISETVPNFPIGAQLVYTVQAQISQGPPPSIVNQVSATPNGVVRCAPAGAPPPCRADVEVRMNFNAIPTPIGGTWVIVLMLLGMVVMASRVRF